MDFANNPGIRSTLALLRRWGLLCVALAVPAFAAEGPPKNPHLQTALRLFDALEYEKALQVLKQAEQWPSSTAEEKVSIALLEGVLAYETQQLDRGEKAFLRALELDRDAELKIPVSPKVAARLEVLRARLPEKKPEPPPAPLPLASAPEPASRMNLKLPVAIGGGVVALGGMLAWGRAKSLEGKVRSAAPSITTPNQLEDTLQQGRTFEKIGWVLMGLGAATTAGSLLFLDTPAEGAKATLVPAPQGAHLSVSWSLP